MDFLGTHMLKRNVKAIDALGKTHHGILVGHSSINSNNALIKISSNKILEICKSRVKKA